jgi:hypothetical protein
MHQLHENLAAGAMDCIGDLSPAGDLRVIE